MQPNQRLSRTRSVQVPAVPEISAAGRQVRLHRVRVRQAEDPVLRRVLLLRRAHAELHLRGAAPATRPRASRRRIRWLQGIRRKIEFYRPRPPNCYLLEDLNLFVEAQ